LPSPPTRRPSDPLSRTRTEAAGRAFRARRRSSRGTSGARPRTTRHPSRRAAPPKLPAPAPNPPAPGPAERLAREPVPRLLPPGPAVVQTALSQTARPRADRGRAAERIPARRDGDDPRGHARNRDPSGDAQQQPLPLGLRPVVEEVRGRERPTCAEQEGHREHGAVVHAHAVWLPDRKSTRVHPR